MPDAPLNRDHIQAFADKYFGDNDAYDEPSQRSFALLVQVAIHVLRQYHDEDRADLERPETFTPQTLGGIPHGVALMEGLRENLEMDCPDDDFTPMPWKAPK